MSRPPFAWITLRCIKCFLEIQVPPGSKGYHRPCKADMELVPEPGFEPVALPVFGRKVKTK